MKIGRFSLPLAALCASAFLTAPLAAPRTAHASTKGRKNTTILLGAAAAHQLLTGKTTNGILLGAGTAYAYKKYNDSRKADSRRRRSAYNAYTGNRYTNTDRYTSGSRYRSRYGSGDRTYRRSSYSRSYASTPPGWSKGKKTGWGGRSMPPGQAKKFYGGKGHGHKHGH
jgi:hypothetical protein